MSIEAMRKMVNALALWEDCLTDDAAIPSYRFEMFGKEALAAGRKAIAEADKQKPIGYWDGEFSEGGWAMLYEVSQESVFGHKYPNIALYDTPPAQPKREWVGLTDEQIINEADKFDWDKDCAVRFARAIEAAHGIKEEA